MPTHARLLIWNAVSARHTMLRPLPILSFPGMNAEGLALAAVMRSDAVRAAMVRAIGLAKPKRRLASSTWLARLTVLVDIWPAALVTGPRAEARIAGALLLVAHWVGVDDFVDYSPVTASRTRR